MAAGTTFVQEIGEPRLAWMVLLTLRLILSWLISVWPFSNAQSFNPEHRHRTFLSVCHDDPLLYPGDIQFYYQDGELNGLTESGLQLNVHNGSSGKTGRLVRLTR